MVLAKNFGIGTLDLDFIEKYHAVVADSMDYSNLEDLSVRQLNANASINEIFYCINHKVFTQIKERIENNEITLHNKRIKNKLIKLSEERIDGFSPFLNCINSWFQNELDDVIVQERQINEIAGDVIPLLLENL